MIMTDEQRDRLVSHLREAGVDAAVALATLDAFCDGVPAIEGLDVKVAARASWSSLDDVFEQGSTLARRRDRFALVLHAESENGERPEDAVEHRRVTWRLHGGMADPPVARSVAWVQRMALQVGDDWWFRYEADSRSVREEDA